MKFLLWNLENFFLVPHIKSSYNQALKPAKKVEAIINLLNEVSADIMFFCEVGGSDSIEKILPRLTEKYRYFYTEGNSDRGIGLSFLVKENFSNVRFHTHTDHLLPPISLEDRKQPRKFSRDVAELWVCDEFQKPVLIIWGVHLKSAQDRSGSDWRGIRQRSAEVRGLVSLVQTRAAQFPGVVQWLGGDFNGKIFGPEADQEFEHLQVKLPRHKDLLQRLDLPASERASFLQTEDKAIIQLDYLLIPDETPTPIPENSGLIQLWARLGTASNTLKSTSERDLYPSDHLPLLASWPKKPF